MLAQFVSEQQQQEARSSRGPFVCDERPTDSSKQQQQQQEGNAFNKCPSSRPSFATSQWPERRQLRPDVRRVARRSALRAQQPPQSLRARCLGKEECAIASACEERER